MENNVNKTEESASNARLTDFQMIHHLASKLNSTINNRCKPVSHAVEISGITRPPRTS